jgi:hypothetical protein
LNDADITVFHTQGVGGIEGEGVHPTKVCQSQVSVPETFGLHVGTQAWKPTGGCSISPTGSGGQIAEPELVSLCELHAFPLQQRDAVDWIYADDPNRSDGDIVQLMLEPDGLANFDEKRGGGAGRSLSEV